MDRVSKLYLDGTAITKLPTSMTGLVSLNARDCTNIMSLPSTFFNMTWLKDLDLFRCSKLLENLGSSESVDMVRTFKKIAFKMNFKKSMDMSSSSNPMGLLSSSLFGFVFFEQSEFKLLQSQGNPQ